jgi:hypothetical protein
MPGRSTQSPVSHNPQAHEDPYCTQCCQVSDTVSPKKIVPRETLDYKKHMIFQLGQYCQVNEEDNPRNSQIARTKGAISFGTIKNLQGGFKFMALNSRKKIVRRIWDVIPIPDLVIDRVNALGSDQLHQMKFTDRHDLLIPQVRPAHTYPIFPWDMIHLPGGDNAVGR